MVTSLVASAVAALLAQPGSVMACAACYGQSDSPLAAGMNWGIISLLGFVVLVLSGVAAFFVYLAKRAGTVAAAAAGPALASPPAHRERRRLAGEDPATWGSALEPPPARLSAEPKPQAICRSPG